MKTSSTVSFLLLSLASFSSAMASSISSPRRLGEPQDQKEHPQHQRNLNFRDMKDRLVFEQVMGGGPSARSAGSTHSRNAQHQQETIATVQAKIKNHRPRNLQSTRSMSFQNFCSTVTSIYEAADYTCTCDSVDLYAACYRPLSQYHSFLLLSYDSAIQDYDAGIDCVCTTPFCDSPPTDCVLVWVDNNNCAVADITVDSSTCYDCRICSTATGLVEVEADGCYTTNDGCMQTLLLAEVPGSSSNPGPSPTSPPVPSPTRAPVPAPTRNPTNFPTGAPETNPPTNFPTNAPETNPPVGNPSPPDVDNGNGVTVAPEQGNGGGNPNPIDNPFGPTFGNGSGGYMNTIGIFTTLALAFSVFLI